MEFIDKQDLAFQYVHGLLDPAAKMKVFQLVLSDKEFKEYLKEELLIVQRMQQLRHSLDEGRKAHWLKRIKENDEYVKTTHSRSFPLVHWVLKMTMPTLAYQILDQIQRRCWR